MLGIYSHDVKKINAWKGLKKSFKSLNDHFNGSKSSTEAILGQEPVLNLIAKIIKIIYDLELETLPAQTFKSFKEFAEHVQQQQQVINTSQAARSRDKVDTISVKNRFFSIEQWSKKRATTFFLGDKVGCCLATTGVYFEAMVQRRLDDGMLFHVAMDKTTNTPAALIWLYLATTSEGRLVLVANFFEVNTKYAQDEDMRLALLDGLLEFTHQYCLDNPGIDGFYMNPLSYGWNVGDLDKYEVTPLVLADKLGGPFLPDLVGREAMLRSLGREEIQLVTNTKYYLASLDKKAFHRFDAAVLEKSKQGRYKRIVDLIDEVVGEVLQTDSPDSLEDLVNQVLTKSQLIIVPFYNGQLQENPALREVIRASAEKLIASWESKGKTESEAGFVLSPEYTSLMFFKTVAKVTPKECLEPSTLTV